MYFFKMCLQCELLYCGQSRWLPQKADSPLGKKISGWVADDGRGEVFGSVCEGRKAPVPQTREEETDQRPSTAPSL